MAALASGALIAQFTTPSARAAQPTRLLELAPVRIEARLPEVPEPGLPSARPAAPSAGVAGMGEAFRDGMIMTGRTSHRLILFTFDDGPDRRNTPLLLDRLDAANVRAVFFLTAQRLLGRNLAERQQIELAREIQRRGHLIGSHTMDHEQLPLLDDAQVIQQVEGAEAVLEGILGARPWLFRPPGGARSPRIDQLLAARGYTSVLWNLGSGDFQVQTADEVFQTWLKVLERREHEFGERGGIVLMHDTYAWSVDAFQRIHDELMQRNCRLLEQGEELYDVVDDPSLFFTVRGDQHPSLEAPPAEPAPEVLAERQQELRAETALRCMP